MTERLSLSPGSLAQFAQEKGLDPRDHETLDAFTQAADDYRIDLAASRGIRPEELHLSPNPGNGIGPEDVAEAA